MPERLDLTRGAGLEAARLSRGWSQNKLHKVSGISRRQIADAERGKNLTCDTLKTLMVALEVRTIAFDSGSTVRFSSGMDVASVLEASEEIDRLSLDVAERLRILSARLRQRSAIGELDDDGELSAQAAQLVKRFAQQAAKRSPEELDALAELLATGLSHKTESRHGTTAAVRKRARK